MEEPFVGYILLEHDFYVHLAILITSQFVSELLIVFGQPLDFHTYTSLREINLRHPEKSLESLQQRVNQKLAELKKKFPHNINQVNGLRTEFKELGLVPETTYLYMQGHHVMDNVVMKLLIPVCTVLRREREQEIKRLAEHNEQFRNELTCYQNSQVNVEIMLKKNVAYKRLFHYDWLRQDISEYLEEGKNKEENQAKQSLHVREKQKE